MDLSKDIKRSYFKNIKVNKAFKQSNKERSSDTALLADLNKHIKQNHLNNIKVYQVSIHSIEKSNLNTFLLANLITDPNTTLDDKLEYLKTLYVK